MVKKRSKEYLQRHSQTHWKNFKLFREQFKDKCSRCGYDYNPKILHFHHTDKDKEYEMSKIRTKKRFLEEIKKCVLLCPNCHAELHTENK